MRSLAIRLLCAIVVTIGFSQFSLAQKQPSSSSSNPSLHVGFVTNCVADFWTIAIKGARNAAAESGIKITVYLPPNGIGDQNRMVDHLLKQKVDAIGISLINAKGQQALLRRVVKQTTLVLHDTDAPNSGHACFVGIDNYKMGRDCGKLIKEAIPNGGKVVPFVGMMRQDNAMLRWQGMIDALLDRKPDPKVKDDSTKTIKGKKYTILPAMLDSFDLGKAKSNAEDMLAKYPDLKCMVGLFAYNPPVCLLALKAARKTGQVKLVGFDQDESTLQGIKDGHIHGTVAQEPYKLGYHTVKILIAAAQKNARDIPASKFVDIGHAIIRKNNANAFHENRKNLLQRESNR